MLYSVGYPLSKAKTSNMPRFQPKSAPEHVRTVLDGSFIALPMRLFGFFVGVPVRALAIAVIWQLAHQMGMEQTE